jgi:hypothetical protein
MKIFQPIVTGSLSISGSIFFPSLVTPSTAVNNVVMYGTNGQLFITASNEIGGSNTGSFTGSFTGNLTGTASYASQSLSSSYAETASFAPNYVLNSGTSSFATTGSNIFSGSQVITGSLIVTGSSESWTGPPHNYKISGQWYSQAENATAYGTVAHATGSGTTNSIYMVPWVISRTQTFTSGAIENTLSNSLLNARFGLYRANPTSSIPQTLLYDSGDINLSGATVKIVSFASPITLTPGLYYTAFTVSGSFSAATMRSLGVSAFAAVIGLSTPGGASNGSYINATRPWAVANANMAFPSDVSTLTLNYTVGAIYATWFRLQ